MTAAVKACRGAFAAVGLFSGMINVLMLTGSFFMLQVYDRVIPSRSVPTLVALVALVAGLYAFQGVLEMVRARVLVRDRPLARRGAQRPRLRGGGAAAA